MNEAATYFQDIENGHHPLGSIPNGTHVFRRYVTDTGNVWEFDVGVRDSASLGQPQITSPNEVQVTTRARFTTTALARTATDQASESVRKTFTVASKLFVSNLGNPLSSRVAAANQAKGWIESRTFNMFGTAGFIAGDSDDAV